MRYLQDTWFCRNCLHKQHVATSLKDIHHACAVLSTNVEINFFSISRQLPEDWIDDARCHICGYSERSTPKLCLCNEYLKQVPRIGPVAPSRGTLPRKKVRLSPELLLFFSSSIITSFLSHRPRKIG